MLAETGRYSDLIERVASEICGMNRNFESEVDVAKRIVADVLATVSKPEFYPLCATLVADPTLQPRVG